MGNHSDRKHMMHNHLQLRAMVEKDSYTGEQDSSSKENYTELVWFVTLTFDIFALV